MRNLCLVLLLTALPAAAAAAPAAPAQEEVRPAALPERILEGSYRAKVSGILCEGCKRAILRELRVIKELSDASFDLDDPVLRFTVAKGKVLKTRRIERALRKASEVIDLDTRFVITSFQEE
ncbi:MAG: hypothetical protein WC969_07405 [Elusimicrobiota bacterium]|jgi:hypothetical protein